MFSFVVLITIALTIFHSHSHGIELAGLTAVHLSTDPMTNTTISNSTSSPTISPSRTPSCSPSRLPSKPPTARPTNPTADPTLSPTRVPTTQPSDPSANPTAPPSVTSENELFAVVGGSQCAEGLRFGPQGITTMGSADGLNEYFMSTSVGLTPHQKWLQIVTTNGVNEIFRIYWNFNIARSVPDRFYYAVNFGESVSYRVVLAATGEERFLSGTWRFSTTASIPVSKLSNSAPSTCCLSADDGLWGAGNGVINGDVQTSISFWGLGNWSGSDPSCGTIYQDGGASSSSATTKSYMYFDSTPLPSAVPTMRPTQPTSQPSSQPSRQPSVQPTSQPTQPTAQPSRQPSRQPLSLPTAQPSKQPSVRPTGQPFSQPTQQPMLKPTSRPSAQPAGQPSAQPSQQPFGQPSMQPTGQPSTVPSLQFSMQPSGQPSIQPSARPSQQPISHPSALPSVQPSGQPTEHPSSQPNSKPSRQPTSEPKSQPSSQPILEPSCQPTAQPSLLPSAQPSIIPLTQPSLHHISHPTAQPTGQPSSQPRSQPSASPTTQPSCQPSAQPTSRPTARPILHSNWEAPLTATDTVRGLFGVSGSLWVCGSQQMTGSAQCDTRNATTGAILGKYTFPWANVTDVMATKQSNTFAVAGIRSSSIATVTSDVALCKAELSQTSCSVVSFQDTSFTATAFVPFANKVVLIGSYRASTTVAVVDAKSSVASSFVYTISSVNAITFSHMQSPQKYIGSFTAGTSISATSAVNSIVAGVVRTDSGKLTLMRVVPASGSILNTAELVNAMALEDSQPDSFIAGGLQLSGEDTNMHAYLLRVNALFGDVLYGTRYRAMRSNLGANITSGGNRRVMSEADGFSSLSRGMVRIDSALYMIVDVIQNVTKSSVTVMHLDMQTGLILQQVHLVARNASLSCLRIVASAESITIACHVTYNISTTKSVLINTNSQLLFAKLPVGLRKQPNVFFTEETLSFQASTIPVMATVAQSVVSSYNYSTVSGVQTFPPSFAPSSRPSTQPSSQPSSAPSGQPTSSPTAAPSVSPQPTSHPSSSGPTNTYKPTVKPTQRPSSAPSKAPSVLPTLKPTLVPSARPSVAPTIRPSLSPSCAPSLAPTPALTIKPTMKPVVAPSARPTFASTVTPTVVVATAAIGGTRQQASDAVMIFLYVLAGLFGVFCVYQILKCYFYTQRKAQWKKVVDAHLDIIRLSTTDPPSRAPRLPAPVLKKSKQCGAFANSASLQRVDNNVVVRRETAPRPITSDSVGSDRSSSVLLSSLHSSEMSYISYSIYSDEQQSDVYHTQRCSSREGSMEEGNTNNSTDSRISVGGECNGATLQKGENCSLSSSEDSDDSIERKVRPVLLIAEQKNGKEVNPNP